ncbi:helix-turn-helix domain-containing protein [Mangrovibacterium lignilyticum]|uniref:helix-turn-helix domain-containing protein n=1 Tax=Mangrovibacterium lignilyticum TaxID=2668052 RepID=UPI0013D67E88|nr:helix-turn-helix domain-containing protein [Mangrovibacterium lignilyticum]
MNDLDHIAKKRLLEHVLSTSTFAKSPTSSVLLEYLVNSTLAGADLKETSIGVDLLGDKFDAESGNARIRVNIYNLRKKLDNYYEDEGAEDAWRMVIEKGQYRVDFVPNKIEKPVRNRRRFLVPILLSALLLSWLIFFLVNRPEPAPFFWKGFFDNDASTSLVIGDSYGLMGELATGTHGWFRDYNINSLDEVYAFLEKHPELKNQVEPANYFYTTGMAAFATKELAALFQRNEADFTIRFSSNSSYSDIIEGNSIYVGPLKNENKFIRLFNEGNRAFNLQGNRLQFSGDSIQPQQEFNLSTEGLVSEYAIVSRMSGPKQTARFLFFSDHDIGVKATVEYFTNADSAQAFATRYFDGRDASFTAVFETRGVERNRLKLNPVLVSEIH